MKVIGAGLPRTATLTQKVALEMLGMGPCYHMVNVLADLRLVELWRDALEGRPDWERIFDGFGATVDWPGAYFYRELAEAYPQAKVLLSVRNPEAWERSIRETVWGVIHGDTLMCHLSLARAAVDPQWRNFVELLRALLWEDGGTLAARHAEPQGLMEAMRRHNEAVKRAVPAERLLVWDVTEGWEPLCDFLEVEVPSVPMPHVNDSQEFRDRMVDMALSTLQQWWQAQRS